MKSDIKPYVYKPWEDSTLKRDPIKVELNETEKAVALVVTHKQIEHRKRTGKRDKQIDSKRGSLKTWYEGNMAEVAVAKFLNCYPRFDCEQEYIEPETKSGDIDLVVGCWLIDVKCTRREHGNLLMQAWKTKYPMCDVFGLVTGENGIYHVVGFCSSARVRRSPIDYSLQEPAHKVTQDKLAPPLWFRNKYGFTVPDHNREWEPRYEGFDWPWKEHDYD